MKPRLHIIVGPTTSGKTARAVALAEQTGAPVIVLDRIQCFPDLATGSGRPSAAEVGATRRIYLADRQVIDGELPADQANTLLHQHVAALAHVPLLILEGGSVSLLKTIAADPRWRAHEQTWERLPLQAPAGYLSQAKARILSMLLPSNGTRSMLDELSRLWSDQRSHHILRGIVGYRTAISYAEQLAITPAELGGINIHQALSLADKIALDYLDYARWQERELPGAM